VRAILLAVTMVAAFSACGGSGLAPSGGGGTPTPPSGANVQPVTVDNGPAALASTAPTVNTLYTSVTVCEPNTTTCQTIDHIQVDTGSYGLRVIGSVLTGVSLPAVVDSAHATLAECTPFVDGSSWGPLRQADIKISGEVAMAQTIQVIGDASGPAIPAGCSGTPENTVATFGANGILGIGPFIQDCGAGCATQVTGNPYWACTSNAAASCAQTTVPTSSQVSNPVAAFPTDNNGISIQLPAVASAGAASVSGSLVFGIDTQSNNGLGNATVIGLNASTGALTTQYNGSALTTSFIDSGSNGYFFADSTIPACPDNAAFFCPTATLNLTATLQGVNGTSATATFSIANADNLFAGNSAIAALSNLGGPVSATSGFGATDVFDWGLPFYFGRTVFTAIEQHTTTGGSGPYFAF
jgi:hypothetical protein